MRMCKWISGTKCDICGKEATEQGEFFFDAKLNWWPNAWALICARCVDGKIFGLGLGLGQQYRSSDKENVWPETYEVKPLRYKPNPIDKLL